MVREHMRIGQWGIHNSDDKYGIEVTPLTYCISLSLYGC